MSCENIQQAICKVYVLFNLWYTFYYVYFRTRRVLLRRGTRQSHLEMITVLIRGPRKIKAARERYIHLLVGSIVPTYRQTMVNKAMTDDRVWHF